MKLSVSLPDNELELAQAAAAGGADAVKVHMNVVHRASGAAFGGFAEERGRVLKVIAEAGLPVGLMPGQERLPAATELQELADAGLSFLDIYAHHLPASYLPLAAKLDLIPAIDRFYSEELLEALTGLRWCGKRVAAMLEAAIVPPEDYGTPLSALDAAHYHALAEASEVPLLIPTQKAITPDDLPAIAGKNIGGIMIGVIVTGRTAGGLQAVTAQFRRALDGLAGSGKRLQ